MYKEKAKFKKYVNTVSISLLFSKSALLSFISAEAIHDLI